MRLAGGRNVAASSGVPFPVVSPEMILRLEPEVIIDLVPEQAVQRLGRKRIRHDWQALERVPAVAAGCVFVVADDRAVLPGELQGEDEVLVLLDCHELERIGPAADGLTGREKVVVIDHHLTGDGDSEGEVQWIEPAAAASASMVHSLVGAMEELSLSGEVASCLYAGLITDTGGFRFSNTDATTLHVGGDLVEHGADAAALAESFLHRRSPATLRLLARVLDSFDYRLGGKVVLARMTRAMCEETGGRMEDTEGFVNFATSAEGVELVALLKEVDEQTWRVSLRANDPYDVQRVAETFGGGGHAKAAGCTLQGPVEEVEERILEALSRELQMETAEG